MPTLKSQYMEAEQTVPIAAKTKTWAIKSKSGCVLGWVKWYGPWRQYCFFPEDALFNVGCLASLVAFLSDANAEHRAEKKQPTMPGM